MERRKLTHFLTKINFGPLFIVLALIGLSFLWRGEIRKFLFLQRGKLLSEMSPFSQTESVESLEPVPLKIEEEELKEESLEEAIKEKPLVLVKEKPKISLAETQEKIEEISKEVEIISQKVTKLVEASKNKKGERGKELTSVSTGSGPQREARLKEIQAQINEISEKITEISEQVAVLSQASQSDL